MENNYIKPIGETLQDKIQWLEKELFKEKEKNKQLTDEYMIQKHLINAEFLDDYIPKSKVEVVIEGLKEGIKRDMINYDKEADESWKLAIHRSMAQKIETKKVLQSLLGKE